MLWRAKEIGNHCSTGKMLFYYIHQYFISADAYFPVTATSKTNILLYIWDHKFWDKHTHMPKWPHNWNVVTSCCPRSRASEARTHANVHLMGGYILLCLIKCRLQLKLSPFLGHCQRHSPGLSGVSWGLLSCRSLSLITACAHIYTQSDCISLISYGN